MLEIGVLALIFIVSFILIYRDFKLSLYVLIVMSVLLHKELFSFYKWDLLPVRLFMLALTAVGFLKVLFYTIKVKSLKPVLKYFKDPLIIILLLIWISRAISLINTANLLASLQLFTFFTTAAALGVYIYVVFKDSPSELLKYIRFFVYVVFALTLFGLFQFVLYEKTGRIIGALWNVPGKLPRIGSTFWDVNHYGALIAAVLPILGVFIIRDKKWSQKVINTIMLLGLVASLLLTNSRSAWLMAAFAVGLFVVINFLKRFGKKGLIYVLIALIVGSTPFLYMYQDKHSPFRTAIKAYFHYRVDSYDSHLMLLTGTYQIFEKFPFIGGGYGSFFEHFSKTKIAPTFFSRDPAALNTRVPAHTIWGESVAETGVLGTTFYVLLCILLLLAPLYVFFTDPDKTKSLLGAAMASVSLGWFVAGIFYSYNSEFFWIITFLYLVWVLGTIGSDYLKKISNYFFTKSGFLLSGIIFISAFLIFINLGVNHLIPWDEAIYAKVAKNMVVNNQYGILHWDSLANPWFEKPPLYMWIEAFLMKNIGFTSLAAKLPSAVFGLGTVILVYLISKKFFNKTIAFISSLALVTTVHFLYYSRMAMLDVSTTFFITLSLLFYWNAKEKQKIVFWILSGISAGLGFMIKGVVGLLPYLAISLYEIYLFASQGQRLNKKLILGYISTLTSFLAVTVPWHLYMNQTFGYAFWKSYIGYHVLERATSEIENKGEPFFWYLTVMKVSMRLWFVVFLGAFPLSLFKAFNKDKKFVFLVLWALSFFLFFSVAKSKLIWYIIPVYPAACIMVGYFIEKVLSFVMGKFRFTNNILFKTVVMYMIIVTSLFYLFMNRQLVYTSDLNGSQARLIALKDEVFGKRLPVYIDRIDFPTPLFYSDSPFYVIDFRPDVKDRVPTVPNDQPLILITKEGRFSETVVGYTQAPHVIQEDGDWVLWYLSPKVATGYVPNPKDN